MTHTGTLSDSVKAPSNKAIGPRVSILMRSKDRPLCLKRALEHLGRQSFRDFHLYLLNDGGDEGMVERLIAAARPVLPEHVTIIHHHAAEGRGQALAELIEKSTEDYILIHDDDDTIEPEFLARTVAFLDDHQNGAYIGVVTSNYDIVERISDKIYPVSKTEQFGKRLTPYIDLMDFLARDNVIIPISLLFRRSTLEKSGNANPDFKYLEDYDLFLRLLVQGDFGSIAEPLASYHHREDNNSAYDTARSVCDNPVGHDFYNRKLRQALLEGDETARFLALAVMQKRNRAHILQTLGQKIDEQSQVIMAMMQTLYGENLVLMGKINQLEEKLEKWRREDKNPDITP